MLLLIGVLESVNRCFRASFLCRYLVVPSLFLPLLVLFPPLWSLIWKLQAGVWFFLCIALWHRRNLWNYKKERQFCHLCLAKISCICRLPATARKRSYVLIFLLIFDCHWSSEICFFLIHRSSPALFFWLGRALSG